jgi:hypothetical protein
MLISLHMPKTAGNSFLQALDSVFGKGLRQDYSDMSRIQNYLAGELAASEVAELPVEELAVGTRCIHGHFLPAKYLSIEGQFELQFVTWLRDPVDRLVSHYNFFRRSFDPATAGPLFRRIIEEDWSLEQFCFSEQYRNVYSKYLWHFPYEHFDFVGLIEFYNEDLDFFAERFLGTKVKALKLNCAASSDEVGKKIDIGFRREVAGFHADDVTLYERALHDRERRA